MTHEQSRNPDVTIGQNIAARRRAFGWSRAHLADLLMRDASWVRRVEEGQPLSPADFFAVVEVLRIADGRVLLQPEAFY